MGKIINLGILSRGDNYTCRKEWPADCAVQAGDNGVVIRAAERGGNYRTAFFEAFPRNPDTFIRGEGATIQEAEEKVWEKYQQHLACPNHEYERRGYENGVGFCKHCGLFSSNVFAPKTRCVVCDTPTYYSQDAAKKWYCEAHVREKPVSQWTEVDWYIVYNEYEMWAYERGVRTHLDPAEPYS